MADAPLLDDRHPYGPIWENLDFLRQLWTHGMRPENSERDAMKEKVLHSLHGLGLPVELSFGRADDAAQAGPTDASTG